MSADSPKLQKAKTTPAITAAASALSTSDASTASTSDVANKDAGAKRHNKSKTANNGASHFDLTELSAVLRADTRAQVERTQVAHLAARTAICCDVCGESIIPALWRRPLARGFMLKRGAVSATETKGEFFFFFFSLSTLFLSDCQKLETTMVYSFWPTFTLLPF